MQSKWLFFFSSQLPPLKSVPKRICAIHQLLTHLYHIYLSHTTSFCYIVLIFSLTCTFSQNQFYRLIPIQKHMGTFRLDKIFFYSKSCQSYQLCQSCHLSQACIRSVTYALRSKFPFCKKRCCLTNSATPAAPL